MHIISALLTLFLITSTAFAQFPVIEQGDLVPNDRRLGQPINESKEDELTIATFNIRNLGSRSRGLKDYEAIVDLFDEADVLVVQEAGLGVYASGAVSDQNRRRLDAVVAIFQRYLMDEWIVTRPPAPSGEGQGAETSLLMYRKRGKGYTISHSWVGYIDLGEQRDMTMFQLTMTHETKPQIENLLLGSVHLTPDDPERGQQMIQMTEWLLTHQHLPVIVMGDFNWGYRRTSNVENYLGETRVKELHDQGKLFQVLYHLSYIGNAKGQQLRTNMGFRSSGYFYDQFLTTPPVAAKLADGGKLLEDVGMIAFGVHNRHMKTVMQRSTDRRTYALQSFMKTAELTPDTHPEAYQRAMRNTELRARDDATWILSDHRLLWIQLKLWQGW